MSVDGQRHGVLSIRRPGARSVMAHRLKSAHAGSDPTSPPPRTVAIRGLWARALVVLCLVAVALEVRPADAAPGYPFSQGQFAVLCNFVAKASIDPITGN